MDTNELTVEGFREILKKYDPALVIKFRSPDTYKISGLRNVVEVVADVPMLIVESQEK